MWLACHRGLVGHLVLGPMYLWVHRWVWEAVKIGGTDPLQIFLFFFFQQKNDCSYYSCSTLQYCFWIEIKMWGVCLTLLLIPAPQTLTSPASQQQSQDPGPFPTFWGSRTPVSI